MYVIRVQEVFNLMEDGDFVLPDLIQQRQVDQLSMDLIAFNLI